LPRNFNQRKNGSGDPYTPLCIALDDCKRGMNLLGVDYGLKKVGI